MQKSSLSPTLRLWGLPPTLTPAGSQRGDEWYCCILRVLLGHVIGLGCRIRDSIQRSLTSWIASALFIFRWKFGVRLKPNYCQHQPSAQLSPNPTIGHKSSYSCNWDRICRCTVRVSTVFSDLSSRSLCDRSGRRSRLGGAGKEEDEWLFTA